MLIRFEIDTRGYGIPDSDRRILRAIADAGNADAPTQAAPVDPQRIWRPTEAKIEATGIPLDKLSEAALSHATHLKHVHLGAQQGPQEATQAHPELHRAFAEENAAAAEQEGAEQEGDEDEGDEDTSGLPRHPDGRIVGRAPEGKKRRTKAQIAEDEAWEAAQDANEASDRAPVPDEEPEPPSAPIVAPQQQGFSGPADESHAAADEQAAQPAPQEQEASSPWSW